MLGQFVVRFHQHALNRLSALQTTNTLGLRVIRQLRHDPEGRTFLFELSSEKEPELSLTTSQVSRPSFFIFHFNF